MGTLREKCPTKEEFIEAVRKSVKESFPQKTDEEIAEMINSQDGQDFINEGYDSAVADFEMHSPHNQPITRDIFLNGCANAVAYNFYMWF